MRVIPLAALVPVPWKNGGGLTREIAGRADANGPLWRLSRADIARDGPFSAFPGQSRILTLVAGAGLVLEFPDGPRAIGRLAPLSFDGETPVSARLDARPVEALNLILRRGVATDVRLLTGPVHATLPRGTVLLHVVTGTASVGGLTLNPGDTVLDAAGDLSLPPGSETVWLAIGDEQAKPKPLTRPVTFA